MRSSAPRRIRLWYGSSGTGHLLAARAVEAALRERCSGAEIEVEDVYRFLPRHRRWLYTAGWRLANRFLAPVYGSLWRRRVSDHGAAARERPLYRAVFHRVERDLAERPADIIIAAHPVGMELAALARQRGLVRRAVGVVTDFHFHAYLDVPGLDAIALPHERVPRLIAGALSPTRATGIPLRPMFGERRELAASPAPTVLFSRGGDAWDPAQVGRVVNSLAHRPWRLRFVNVRGVGSVRELPAAGARRATVALYPYWRRFADLLSEADVHVAKPGGLVTAESLALGVPMVATDPRPGQEENNIRFLEEQGAGVAASWRGLEAAILSQLCDPRGQRGRIATLGRPGAARAVVELALGHGPAWT